MFVGEMIFSVEWRWPQRLPSWTIQLSPADAVRADVLKLGMEIAEVVCFDT